MGFNFYPELSKSYLQILDNGKYSDVIIKVGEGDNSKEYNAHSFVLKIRSEFFEEEIRKKLNISANKIILQYEHFNHNSFEYILRYLYGGSFELDNKSMNYVLNMLIIADYIKLGNLTEVIQKYLVEKRKHQLSKQFSLIHKTCSNNQNFRELQMYCEYISQNNPNIIFKADDFNTLDKNLLIFIIENKKTTLYEIQKWDHIVKWGKAQNPTLPDDISLWTIANFEELSDTLKSIIKLIDYKKISTKDFRCKVKPYKKLLDEVQYEEILDYQLSSNDDVNPIHSVAKIFYKFGNWEQK